MVLIIALIGIAFGLLSVAAAILHLSRVIQQGHQLPTKIEIAQPSDETLGTINHYVWSIAYQAGGGFKQGMG